MKGPFELLLQGYLRCHGIGQPLVGFRIYRIAPAHDRIPGSQIRRLILIQQVHEDLQSLLNTDIVLAVDNGVIGILLILRADLQMEGRGILLPDRLDKSPDTAAGADGKRLFCC